MIEFLAGWFLGQRAPRSVHARASIDLAGVNRYRPLQAWAYVVGRAVGLLASHLGNRRTRLISTRGG
jgi:hypothetical protein